MTSPQFKLEDIVPLKYKPLVGFVGTLLGFIVPTVVAHAADLPDPWPYVIATVVAGLTYLGIYRVPYVPTSAVLAPEKVITPDGSEVHLPQVTSDLAKGKITVSQTPTYPSGGYQNPWKK